MGLEWIEREIDHVLMVRGDTDIANLNEVEAFEWPILMKWEKWLLKPDVGLKRW